MMVDASFAVHPNMRNHTFAVLSLGKEAVYGNSSNQKINTKNSCEAELVRVDDALPDIAVFEGKGLRGDVRYPIPG
jgi:hypothetical protein